MEIVLNKDNFNKDVVNSEKPILVDFWAPWCGPCKVLSPIVEEIGHDYEGKINIGKINVDENNELAMQFGVMSIPTLKFFKGGRVIGEIVGAAPKQMITAMIDQNLAKA
jgi:thioredoxin 1